jgi:hypothetical protein
MPSTANEFVSASYALHILVRRECSRFGVQSSPMLSFQYGVPVDDTAGGPAGK